MTRLVFIYLFLAALLALALRLPHLDQRPMHNDEAVNAVKFGRLWEHGVYRYDPNEHHGPSLPYATLALGRLTGAPDFDHFSEVRLRLVTVLFGLALLLPLPLLMDGLGRRGLIWAGLFTAVSPAMVFYSRYYIHEMLLVFFTFLALAAGWRYWRSRKPGWILLAGASLGLMQATKETFVLTLAAAALALLLNQFWGRLLDASGLPGKARPVNVGHLAAGAGVWILVWAVLLSSFLANPVGLLDSFRTYQPWLHRLHGASAHLHSCLFYPHRLLYFHVAPGPIWSEALILALAIVAGLAGFVRHGLGRADANLVRFLALYTLLLTAIYSLLPYKTPWCLLSFWHGMILLAGVGAGVLLRKVGLGARRMVCAALLLAGVAHLAWQAWQAATTYAADRRNPYVYAQTSPDLLRLVSQIESLAAVAPQGHNLLIKGMTAQGDCWPLPWSLRQFQQIGWWDHLLPDPYAPVMIVSAQWEAKLDEKKTHLMVGYFELRPQVFLELYVQADLWRAWLEKHPPREATTAQSPDDRQ